MQETRGLLAHARSTNMLLKVGLDARPGIEKRQRNKLKDQVAEISKEIMKV